MSFSFPSRKVAALAVAAAGLTTVLSAAFTPAATAATDPTGASRQTAERASSWFVDPRTPAQRRAEVAVPKRPRASTGRLRETRAVYRTHAGRLAVPMRYAFGHEVVQGQALTLDGAGLYAVGSTALTASAKAQLAKAADALANASSVRCEGYADYDARSDAWGKARAVRVCDTLASLLPGLTTTVVSYGPDWPAVLGATSQRRGLNRRVVVEMTGTKPAAPQAKVPGAPTLAYAEGYGSVVYYAFSAPTSDGGAPVTSYQVSTGGAWTTVHDGAPRRGARKCRGCGNYIYGTLNGVAAESSVTVRVRAVNRVGAGAPSNPKSTTVVGAPSEPTAMTSTGDDGVITTTFGPAEHTGGVPITRYEISYDGGDHWSTVTTNGSAPWTVVEPGFENGVVYDVAVRAVNDWGYGEPATAGVRVATLPGAPTLDAPVVEGNSALLSLSAPASDGGSDLTGYELSVDGGQSWDPATVVEGPGGLEITLSDLKYGTVYDVQVRAVNGRGHGPASDPVQVAPVTVPDAPTAVAATVDGTSVTVSFEAPAFDGGSVITGYQVQVDGGSWGVLPPGGKLTGQGAGTHTYAVRAVNAVGPGADAAGDPVEVVVVPQPLWNYGYNQSTLNDGEYWVSFYSGNVDLAKVVGWEVSVNGGAWRTFEQNSSAPYDPEFGTTFWGYVHDTGCVSTGGVCSNQATTGRVRAVYADGYSVASDSGSIMYWD